MKRLTVKQENFCNFYIESSNASDAYRRSHNCEKMKASTITRKAVEMFENGNVTARINELQAELKEKSDLSKERILHELECIINAKITDYLEFKNGRIKFKNFSTLTEEQVRAIESIKKGRNGIELKLHGKLISIERICKMLGYDTPIKIEEKRVDNFDEMTDEELRKFIEGKPN